MSVPDPAEMPSWQRHLGDQLVAAAGRLNHRRQRRRRIAAAVAVVVAIGAGLAGTSWLTHSDSAAAAIHIEPLPNGDVAITIAARAGHVDDAVAALRDAGFDVDLRPDPTGPSRVGQVTSLAAPAGAGERVVIDGDDPPTITLAYGVAAAPGEPYGAPTDPWADGEPLAGVDVDRDDPAAVVRAARDLGLTTRILSPSNGQPLSDVPPTANAAGYLMLAPDLLFVHLSDLG
ncbi:MAG TPA: hypothetical protein VK866_13975 [Acidimicrobiales bacterium]|nr:hypothetical protein [Acidimicrobiales bacterium]